MKELKKPRCKLVGENGNIYNLMGLASKALRKVGQSERATEMCDKIRAEAKSYDDALVIIMDFVDAE